MRYGRFLIFFCILKIITIFAVLLRSENPPAAGVTQLSRGIYLKMLVLHPLLQNEIYRLFLANPGIWCIAAQVPGLTF